MNLASLAIEVKKKLVEEDERDNGSRQLLNFGHTIAHAIEKMQQLPHTPRPRSSYRNVSGFHRFRQTGLDSKKTVPMN